MIEFYLPVSLRYDRFCEYRSLLSCSYKLRAMNEDSIKAFICLLDIPRTVGLVYSDVTTEIRVIQLYDLCYPVDYAAVVPPVAMPVGAA